MEETKIVNYVPTAKEAADRTRVYGHIETMRQLKDKNMPHFQSRSRWSEVF